MSNSIIEVNNLSKNYIIAHEGREKYTALRDVMARKAKKLFSFPSSLRGGTTKQSPYKENFWALKDINFEIQQGDRVGIIGRNGAGKSTLLKILSRIIEPTTGTIKIKGRVASLLEVGTGFHPELTGRENIFLNGAILGMSRADIRKHFDAIVDFAEVEKFLDTPVKRYSSGMYVRLAFAVAAHLEPEILIVDEVLAVGDAEFQKKCLGKMEDVSRNEGRTVLFVSHNTTAIKNLTQKIIYLIDGKMEHTVGNTSVMIDMYLKDSIQRSIETKDTDHYRRANRNPIASIVSVQVNNFRHEFPTIRLNEKITFTLKVNSTKEINDPDVNLIIKNAEGSIVTSIVSRDFNFKKNIEEGENLVVVSIPNNCFTPGKYFGILGIGPNDNGLAFDVLVDYPLFEISAEGELDHWQDRPFGNFFVKNVLWE